MGSIRQKCPYCGSRNISTYKYGFPLFDEKMQKKLNSGEWILGGCCLNIVGEGQNTVVMDPSRRCNDCKKDFGKPPVIVSRKNKKVEDYGFIVTGIKFFVGGYGGPNTRIEIKKTIDGARISIYVFPIEYLSEKIDLSDPKSIPRYPKKIKISSEKWISLLNTLYNDMHLHEWKKRFVDPDVLDGTQWSLEIMLTNRRKRTYYGSNAYPPYWKQLLNVMKKYAELEELY